MNPPKHLWAYWYKSGHIESEWTLQLFTSRAQAIRSRNWCAKTDGVGPMFNIAPAKPIQRHPPLRRGASK